MARSTEGSPERSSHRITGAAFLLQAAASAVVGLVLLEPLEVPGSIAGTMANFANHALRVRAGIVGEMVTVTALVVLSVLLYGAMKAYNRNLALTALGLRLTEVALLAVSRVATFAFLRISQEFVIAGHSEYLQMLGGLAFETQEFAYTVSMLFFALGGTLFYYLIYRSKYVPRALALLGLVAAPLSCLGTVAELCGQVVPLVVHLPNLPYELAMGIWLILKGTRDAKGAIG